MAIKKSIGRPQKVTFSTMAKLADAIQHSSTVSDACRYAGISRDTYYRYLNEHPIFAKKMDEARSSQNKVVFSFLTPH